MSAGSTTITFSVDAAILRELGERLVGKPSVALAELIKNAYDADATIVELRWTRGLLEVSDNGHGMSEQEFRSYWMRIGSPHKGRQRLSAGGRSLTGQKGIGRLAVQFLGRKLKITTTAKNGSTALVANVDWDKAVSKTDLTKVDVEYQQLASTESFPEASPHGTTLSISELSQSWAMEDIKSLALEIWSLQPPFGDSERSEKFRVNIIDAPQDFVNTFAAFTQAFRTIWHARIVGTITAGGEPGSTGKCDITVLFEDGKSSRYVRNIASCSLRSADFNIAVYSLSGRQPFGVSVQSLRDYLKRFGGVGVYDTGFRLPFYGVDTDWLRIQLDHSRRLTTSELLPLEISVEKGLNFLPTNARILGVVNVNTGDERKWGMESRVDTLGIDIGRGRLVENTAFGQLRDSVRSAIDFYAMQEAARELQQAESKRSVDRSSTAVQRIAELAEEFSEQLPSKVKSEMKSAIEEALSANELERDLQGKQSNLLGALATAGMAAAAMEHESARQIRQLEALVQKLRSIARRSHGPSTEEIRRVANDLEKWISEVRQTRELFMDIADPDHRTARSRLRTRAVLEQVVARLGPILRSVPVDLSGVPPEARLPSGTFVEWSALFQNVLTNAVNATLGSASPRIVISQRSQGKSRQVRVQDNGVGVEISDSEALFEPFVRRVDIPEGHRGLGIGGTGLGLAIVKMIAHNLSCRVGFVEPEQGLSTAFRLAWVER